MFNRAERNGKALSLLIVWTMVIGGFFAAVAAFAPAAQAGQCDVVGGVITGTWTITTAQTCSGIVYTVDGSITINSPGSLTLINGGLRFAKDGSHRAYALTVNAGASLTLDNSIVTTQVAAIDPYPFLPLTVTGAGSKLVMKNNAVLKFPGWFNTSANADLNITDSVITGFTDAELSGVYAPASAAMDAVNDGPVISWSSATASLYRSRVERLYEATGGALNMALSGTSLYAYDSYIGVDYSNLASKHNVLTVDGTSKAYLFNVTIDRSQDPVLVSDYDTAFVAAGAGNIFLYRWAHVKAVDAGGAAISGATVWSRLTPSAYSAQYPDASYASVPSSRTLWYLGRTPSGATQWNRTDASGEALIPLYTDNVTSASYPNAVSFGNYQETGTFSAQTATATVSFPAYPNVTASENNRWATLTFSGVQGCSSSVTTWGFTRTISGAISIATSLEITGTITLVDATLYVDQQPDACAYIKVRGATGSLTLVNTTVWSNYPLAFFVSDSRTLTVSQGSQLLLTQRGTPGSLVSDATSHVVVRDSTIDGNVNLAGTDATLNRVTLYGPSLRMSTSAKSRLWDADIASVTSLALLSNDLDIRNMTFDAAQTSQLVFSTQSVQLTSVQLYDPTGTWYESMITGTATVSRYWWMAVRAVDGTGTVLANSNVNLTLWRLDPVTLQVVRVPSIPYPNEDLYLYTNTTATTAPRTQAGYVVYRAFQESRSLSGRSVNSTYVFDASAWLGSRYNADGPVQAEATMDRIVDVPFTSLTPDLAVEEIVITGGNLASTTQPLNTDITLTAKITNAGDIDVYNVKVDFFSDNVDKNGDNYLDFPTADFEQIANISTAFVDRVPRNGFEYAIATWHPQGTVETGRSISVVVDPPRLTPADDGRIPETNERNNIKTTLVNLFTWPDLTVTSGDVQAPVDPVVNNDVPLRVTIRNAGTSAATGSNLYLYEGSTAIAGPVTFDVAAGGSSTQTIVWRPSTVGLHNIAVRVVSKNDTSRNTDFNFQNNQAIVSLRVVTPPDLELVQADFGTTYPIGQGQTFSVVARIHNAGQTTAQNVSVALFLDGNLTDEMGRISGINVILDTNVTIQVKAIGTPGTHHLMVFADPDRKLNEGGASQERNNFANITVIVQPPEGTVVINTPGGNAVLEPGVTIEVNGFVRDRNGTGLNGVALTVQIQDAGGTPQATVSATSQASGFYQAFVTIPGNLPDGPYNIVVSAPGSQITLKSTPVTVQQNLPFLLQKVPLLGIQWWLLLVIIAAAAAIIIGATLYFKFYGLGKMVECGECGAFIPEDSTTCPKCGVEFEKDMAKCSNCQAWIPVDVKRCPECGVEFATGEVEMADYQEKMRLQYDEVVTKFKEEAQRQLGRALSDREFQEWWRKQPTFVTFEDWLREEEEMRKMGSKPCPVCGTLNSVTATVCHKCGSLMREQRPPSGGGGGGGGAQPAAVRRAAVAPAAPPPPPEEAPGGSQAGPGGMPPGQDAIPRRVIRKPVAAAPVVQKKVIKRPLGEGGQQGESAEGQGNSSTGSATEDEL